jgi:single-strand DNA-binding protein
MRNLNRWQGIGRLGQDPELKTTPNGQPVASFSMACQDDYKDTQGQKIERTEWVRAVMWGKSAEVFAQYAKKGSKVYVEGKLTTRKWQDKDGSDRYTTEVNASNFEFLDSRSDSAGQGSFTPATSAPMASVNATATAPSAVPFDDDIPF